MDRVLMICLLGMVLIGAHAETTVAPDEDASTSTSSTTSTEAPATSTTTTSSSTSTTPSPTTTTPVPVTTIAPPAKDQFYRVTENNVTCIMFSGDLKFTITYPLKDKSKVNTTTIAVPRADDKNVSVEINGSCSEPQYLVLNWGAPNTPLTLRLFFNMTGEKWELAHTQADVYLDPVNFQNASDLGSTLTIDGHYPGLSNVAVDTNSSFTCRALVESKDFSGKVGSSDSKYEVTSSVVGLELQAYNSVPNTSNLQQGERCEADITSDLVPIAVGCALAGLVLLVLISYLVGRRRRSAAYQSV